MFQQFTQHSTCIASRLLSTKKCKENLNWVNPWIFPSEKSTWLHWINSDNSFGSVPDGDVTITMSYKTKLIVMIVCYMTSVWFYCILQWNTHITNQKFRVTLSLLYQDNFPWGTVDTWLRSLLCYNIIKKFVIEEFVIRVFHRIIDEFCSNIILSYPQKASPISLLKLCYSEIKMEWEQCIFLLLFSVFEIFYNYLYLCTCIQCGIIKWVYVYYVFYYPLQQNNYEWSIIIYHYYYYYYKYTESDVYLLGWLFSKVKPTSYINKLNQTMHESVLHI